MFQQTPNDPGNEEQKYHICLFVAPDNDTKHYTTFQQTCIYFDATCLEDQ